jgi:ribosomal protein L28
MSRICSVDGCEKRPRRANIVSHANNKIIRWVFPNIHKMRFVYVNDPQRKLHRGSVCTKCAKSGKIKKCI